MKPLQHLASASLVALIFLCLAWELWLAPLRPGGSLLALKVLPLAAALPALRRGGVRAYQWWSMGVLIYLCEGVVRAMSDPGASARLAAIQTALALVAFVAILAYVRAIRARR